MANIKELKTRLISRHDTEENWIKNDPVLRAGEIAITLPAQSEDGSFVGTTKFKVGVDNTLKWSQIAYAGAEEAKNYVTTPTDGETDVQAITRVVGDAELHSGDTSIVKRVIADDKISYTAYMYDTEWKAMDGNYNAGNVYFDKDLTYTVGFGTLAKPSSSATFNSKGKSVEQILASLMAKESNPTKVAPAVSFSAQNGFGTFEIGTKKTLSYTAALSAGSYTYGPATGITAQSWSVSCTGVDTPLTTSTGTFENVVAESTAKKITATATYNEGAVPKTNLGNAYPEGKIAAGSASKDSNSLLGVRYMFWGPVTDDSALNSATIRALGHKEEAKAKTLTTFGAVSGAKKVVVAVPTARKITKVIMPSALNADVTALFVKQEATVSVEGAEGYAGADYSIYVYQPASIDAGETYTVTIG